MALPIPDLDDRRFDDLVAELESRLAGQLPDVTRLSPGDPIHALVDLFAWMSETVIYRANRIPERQRRAFLGLLQLPRRPARPASGVVCIDSPGASLPPLVATESRLEAGPATFTTRGEVQPTPLGLRVLVKRSLSAAELAAEGIALDQLRDQYGVEPAAFRPVTLAPGKDPLTTAGSVDGALHLAFALARQLETAADAVRRSLAGAILNVGLAHETEADGELATTLSPRRLAWDLARWSDPAGAPERVEWFPLEVVADGSRGGRTTGVVRLRLPRNPDMLRAAGVPDPQFAGMGDAPPEPPADVGPAQLVAWLRLRSRDGDPVELGWIGVNAVEVVGQGVAREVMLGAGTGQPDQALPLAHADVDDSDVRVEVEENGRFEPWQASAQFVGLGSEDRVFVVDAGESLVRFGDGVRAKRPAAGARIRAAFYRYGGGTATNLPPGAIRSLVNAGRLVVRHEWPTRGGFDAETVDEAERRIPAFLAHRERAVTADDFATLARDNPVRPIARADAVPGFFPGASLGAVRRDLPGVVAVFVLPPGEPALAAAPRPTAGTLRDVFEYLTPRTLLGTELYVLAPQYQPIAMSVALEVTDPATEVQVHRAVEQALLAYLWPLAPHGPRGAGWPRGKAVEVNELRTQAGRVDGVEAVNGVRLFYQDLASAAWRELTGRQDLKLEDYQLPELAAVSLQVGEGPPDAPGGFSPPPPGGPPPAARPVPVPVVPDVC
jgi:baseplate J-like protein